MKSSNDLTVSASSKIPVSTKSLYESLDEQIKQISKRTGLSEQAVIELIWQAVENSKA